MFDCGDRQGLAGVLAEIRWQPLQVFFGDSSVDAREIVDVGVLGAEPVDESSKALS
jgi:hypothetical protein